MNKKIWKISQHFPFVWTGKGLDFRRLENLSLIRLLRRWFWVNMSVGIQTTKTVRTLLWLCNHCNLATQCYILGWYSRLLDNQNHIKIKKNNPDNMFEVLISTANFEQIAFSQLINYWLWACREATVYCYILSFLSHWLKLNVLWLAKTMQLTLLKPKTFIIFSRREVKKKDIRKIFNDAVMMTSLLTLAR